MQAFLGRSTFSPSNFLITGATNRPAITNALTGLPGNPITALPLQTARMVGFPWSYVYSMHQHPWAAQAGNNFLRSYRVRSQKSRQ